MNNLDGYRAVVRSMTLPWGNQGPANVAVVEAPDDRVTLHLEADLDHGQQPACGAQRQSAVHPVAV